MLLLFMCCASSELDLLTWSVSLV